MNRAEIVVQALLEVSQGVEQFLKSLPPSVLATFYIIAPKDIPADERHGRYPYCHAVYVSNPDDTRDFLGHIRHVTEAPAGNYWVTVSGIQTTTGGRVSFDATDHKVYATAREAAKSLLDYQQAASRYADYKKAKAHWRMSKH